MRGNGREPTRLGSVATYLASFPLHDPALVVLTEAAVAMLHMPMAWITLVGEDRQRLLAATGRVPGLEELDREGSFCTATIHRDDHPLLISDTHLDPRFRDNALVRGPLAVRSYAGMPLLGREGLPIGAFCVLGRTARRFTRLDRARLRRLAGAATEILETHRTLAEDHRRPTEPAKEVAPPETVPDWVCTADGVVRELGPGSPNRDGKAARQLLGTEWLVLADPLQRDEIRRRWQHAVRRGGAFEHEFRAHDPDGIVRWLRVLLRPADADRRRPRQAAGDPFWQGSVETVDRLWSRASDGFDPRTHDVLTGVLNRSRFQRLLERTVQDSRLGIPFAVLCLDLDDFKLVNDTLGHEVGDRILGEIGRRLSACVRRTDIVGRLGGDEFLVAQTGLGGPADATALARRIIDTVGRPIPFDGHAIDVGVSIGIALGPRDGSSGPMLMRHADLALYRAKQDGKGVQRFFDPTMDAAVSHRRRIRRDLHQALVRRELSIEYQPILSLRDARVSSLEALLRWQHPARGTVAPTEFIPIAENSGLIVPIGDWVLSEACRAATRWPDDVQVAVNLSPQQFALCDLAETVSRILDQTGLAPARLELEITETVPLLNNERNLRILCQLRALGVRTVLDDFGAGHSSLAYLSRFRFDKIKLDRSFTAGMAAREGLSVARAIIGLAADLEIPVTAEGIESTQQLQQVTGEGCAQAQGFRIARPMAPHRVPAALPRIAAKFGTADRPWRAAPFDPPAGAGHGPRHHAT